MTVKPYGREHALALLEPSRYTDDWTIDDRGIWPQAHLKQLHTWGMDAEYKLASWKPASVFANATDAPDLTKTPALPFPFDGKDLAAFMLAGSGCLVADFYGEWASGPGEHQLSRIDPDNNFAKRAVIEAFDAYRNAIGRVGRLDLELYRRTCESCDAYTAARSEAIARHDTHAVAHPEPEDSDDRRRELGAEYTRRMALVNAELEAQEAETNHLQTEWDKAHQTWLTAMVVCLLEPKPKAATETPEPPPAPAQTAAAPMPVMPASEPEPKSEPVPDRATWTLTKRQRFQGYTEPLYLLLEGAHRRGEPIPTAREVLQSFARQQPSQIAKVIEGESLDYYLVSGETKSANLRAIRAAIAGMAGKSQD